MRPGERVVWTVARDGGTVTLDGTIGERFEADRFGNRYRLGFMGIPWPEPETRTVSLLEAPVVATEKTIAIVRMIVTTLGQVVTGRRPVSELGGPLKIAQVSGEQLNAGIPAFIGFIALISINLGFINLLPIPMLDGGHLLLYAIEAVRRRPASPVAQEWAFRAGFALVVGFMALVTFNDLSSFGLFRG
jgi:regulator of sigma E protease